MILGVLDFESTGTDVLQDEVTEAGQILFTTGQSRVLESSSYFVAGDRPIPKEVEDKVGITNAARKRFGYDNRDSLMGILDWLKKVDAVAGHNILQFDWELLKNWASHYNQTLPQTLVIDTMWDLPGYPGRNLQHMCADHGFLNLMPHCAMADCQSTLALITHRNYALEKIVERAKSPIVILQSHQPFEHNEQAKKRKFHWNDQPGHIWWKAVKEIDVEEIAKEAPFDVSIRRDLNLSELWS